MCVFHSAHFNAHRCFANTIYVFQQYDISVGEDNCSLSRYKYKFYLKVVVTTTVTDSTTIQAALISMIQYIKKWIHLCIACSDV